MQNSLALPNISYMLRHFLTRSVTDPLAETSRGYSDFTQYFSGTGAAGQINYLERRPTTGGRFLVYVYVGGAWVLKALTTDYTFDSTLLTINWGSYTPPSGTDNIKLDYQAIKQWIFDDHPIQNVSSYPRMTVLEMVGTNTPSGQGIYGSYDTGPGDVKLQRYKIIIRYRKADNIEFIYKSVHRKNYELVLAISEEVEHALNTNKVPMFWKFIEWKVISNQRITSEEDSGILRRDMDIDVQYYRGGA